MGCETIQKCTKICAKTGRILNPGEICFSAIKEEENGVLKRLDFSAESWTEPAEAEFLAWWRYLIPDSSDKRVRLAPNDILLELFDRWVTEPARKGELYILTLLLLRRRVFRSEDLSLKPGESKQEEPLLAVYSPRRETTYTIPVVHLSEEETAVIQDELADLLFSGAVPDEVPVIPFPGLQ